MDGLQDGNIHVVQNKHTHIYGKTGHFAFPFYVIICKDIGFSDFIFQSTITDYSQPLRSRNERNNLCHASLQLEQQSTITAGQSLRRRGPVEEENPLFSL